MNMSTGKFSFEAIERALSTQSDWKYIQPTIQLAFNSISETLKDHEVYIKELELQLSNKPSRHELKAEVADKVSFQEFSEHSAHYSSLLDAKLILVEDKLSLSDVQKLLADRITYEEVKKLLESKASVKELNAEIDKIYGQIDKIYQEICESLARLPNTNEMEYFNQELKVRPSEAQVEDFIMKKIEIVNKVLKTKAEKNDILKKADTNDIKSLVNVLETKANSDTIDKMLGRVEKLEKNESFQKKRVEKFIKDSIEEIKQAAILDIDSRMSRHLHEIDKYIHDLNKELTFIRENPIPKLPELDHLKKKINENATWFEQEIDEIKEQMRYNLLHQQSDMTIEKANSRDITSQRVEELEDAVKLLEKDRKGLERNIVDVEKEMKAIYKEISGISVSIPDIKSIDERLNAVVHGKLKELTTVCQGNYEEIKFIKEAVLRKAEASEVEHLIHEKNKLIINNLHEIREEIKHKLKSIQNEVLKKSHDQMLRFYEDKGMENALSGKADKNDLDLLYRELKDLRLNLEHSLLDSKQFQETIIQDMNTDFGDKYNSIILELREKTWTSDISRQIESKPDIQEVNKALISIQNEIDEKLNSDEFTKFVSENSVILNTLCAEICIGRWLWKSGELKDRFVIWDEENTNTNPLLFIWEQRRNFILVEEAGIYEVSFAVFNAKTIELLVNGQLIAVCEASARNDFSGISKSDFIILPARARLSLKFVGEVGQGFISLKKL